MDKIFNVLFLSQRNSARSLVAEALMNRFGKGHFRAFSAGVRPAVAVDPIALEVLEHVGINAKGARPRHFSEFAGENSMPLDFVFTLSDTAAGEAPPAWPGQPITAHWRSEDPEKYSPEDPERRMSLIRTRSGLERRIRVFLNLPLASIDRMSLQKHVEAIGEGDSSAA